jgi:chitinase
MNYSMLFPLLLILSSSMKLSEYYFSGQSTTDDINNNASLVIVAFASINADGTVSMPVNNIPCQFIPIWQSTGTKILFSIGGAGANWSPVFSSNASMNSSIASIATILATTPFNGVDIDLEQYTISPFIIANWLIQLKLAIKGYYLTVTP